MLTPCSLVRLTWGSIGHPQVNAGNIEAFFKKGVSFDGSSVPGCGTVDISDKLLVPLAETFWEVKFAGEKLGVLTGKINKEHVRA